MASGHVNRINRPNKWLHRPTLRREENPCQSGAVHTWHLADIPRAPPNVCFWGQSGQRWRGPDIPSWPEGYRRKTVIAARPVHCAVSRAKIGSVGFAMPLAVLVVLRGLMD